MMKNSTMLYDPVNLLHLHIVTQIYIYIYIYNRNKSYAIQSSTKKFFCRKTKKEMQDYNFPNWEII